MVVLGLVSFSFISTGHELSLELFEGYGTILFLLLILFVRTTLTLSANVSGITDGMFLPILSIGALVSSILGKAFVALGGDTRLYSVIIVLGITACIAGSMKMPLTAIVFSLEALSCHDNIIPVVITAFVAYLITELFGVKSINDTIIELREDFEEHGREKTVVDTYVVVQKGAFAVGKQIRDIFWPRNLFVLSTKKASSNTKIDVHGGKELGEGDILHIRYTTTDDMLTRRELFDIVGEQETEER